MKKITNLIKGQGQYYMNYCLVSAFTIIMLIGLQFSAKSQEVSVEIGETEIGLQDVFSITASVSNDRLNTVTGFPEIQGLTKVGTSSSQNTSIINGKVSSSHSITQNYRATKVGIFVLKPFTIQINGKAANSQGATIKVVQQTTRQSYDPFADFFGAGDGGTTEFLDVKEDAFFAVSTSKSEVYLGEGFNLSVAMYIADANRAFLEFHEIGEQLGEILKKVKPANCWEENFGIEEIVPEVVTIGKKTYRQYKIYQANFYPLNTGNLTIPVVDFKMIKFKVAQNPSFFGNSHVKDFITFKSKEKLIKVKDLPPHPLKGSVAVGNYKLQDELSLNNVKTGQTFNYKYQIVGEGNISSLTQPTVKQTGNFSYYPPNERIQINRSEGTVYGSKQFNYLLSANEAGNYRMSDYFDWIFFNTSTSKYDTLRSRLSLQASGEKVAASGSDTEGFNGFYSIIAESNNELQNTEENMVLKVIVNLLLLSVLAVLGYRIIKSHSIINLKIDKKILNFRKNKQ